MDPSIQLCQITDSFKQTVYYHPDILNQAYPRGNDEKEIVLNPKIEYQPPQTSFNSPSTSSSPNSTSLISNFNIYIDQDRYEVLNTLRKEFDRYTSDQIDEAKNRTNPFFDIGNSIFGNRAGIKLANIDAVFTLFNNGIDFENRQSMLPITFLDIAGGPGAMTQYLQYRYPLSQGMGVTLTGELDWAFDAYHIDRTRFEKLGTTGNVLTEYNNVFQAVLHSDVSSGGLDLIIADGDPLLSEVARERGVDITTLYADKEWIASRLIITEIYLALAVSKPGSKIVIKIFDVMTNFMAQLVYLVSCCFKHIVLFKPVTSYAGNTERYLVGIDRLPNVRGVVSILGSVLPLYDSERWVSNIIEDADLPAKFKVWLTAQNNIMLENQIEAVRRSLAYLANPQSYKISNEYDISKFTVIWNLPSGSEKRQSHKRGQGNRVVQGAQGNQGSQIGLARSLRSGPRSNQSSQ